MFTRLRRLSLPPPLCSYLVSWWFCDVCSLSNFAQLCPPTQLRTKQPSCLGERNGKVFRLILELNAKTLFTINISAIITHYQHSLAEVIYKFCRVGRLS